MDIFITRERRADSLPLYIPYSVPLSFRFVLCLTDEYQWRQLLVDFKPVGTSEWVSVVIHAPTDDLTGDETFTVTADSPQQLNLAPGKTDWRIIVIGYDETEQREEQFVVGLGSSEITQVAGSRSAHVQKMIGLMETTIENRMTGRGDIETYTIGGRRVKTMSLSELRLVLSKYRDEAAYLRKPRQIWYRHR